MSLEREKGRRTSGNHYSSPITNPIGSFPLGLGPSERNCRLCDVSVKRGEVNVHRLGWLHVDRSRTKGFYCEVCKKAFLGPFGIQMHNERIHAPPVMRNVSVNVRFTTTSTRKERKQTKALAVTGNLLQEALSPYNLHWRSIFCDICSTDRTPGENIRSHKRSQQHIDACKAQNLYCGDCDIIFDTRFEQCIHADTHQKLPPKRCDICDEEILESETADGQLQFHLDTFTRSNLHCSECNMHFGTDRVNFLAHTLKSHVPPRPVRFNCRHCNQHFSFEEYIRHNCLNPIAEEIPSATSYSAASYSTQDNKLIDCLGSSKCPRRFKNLSAMIQHLESGTCLQDLDGTGINVLVGRNSAKMEKPHPEVDEEVGRSSSDEQAGETSNGVRVFSLVEQN